MKFPRVLFIQPLLPSYSIDFFNEMKSQAPELELTVAADLKSKSALNQLDQRELQFKAVNLEFSRVGPFQWIKGLRALVDSPDFDIVVFNGNPRDLSQLLAMAFLRMRRRTFFVWGMFHKIGRQKWHTRFYYQLVAKLANKLLTYSRTGARNLASLGVPERKISVIGTAIDQRRVRKHAELVSERDKARFLEEQGLVGKKIVLQVVRLSAIKKPGFLIDAAREILRDRDDVVFVLIGDGEMREELEAKVKSYGLSDGVRFMGAIYDEAVLARWYLTSTVFVMPTCIGLSAHHSMAYGLPVVTDDSVESQASEFDIVYHMLNGIVYKNSSLTSLAKSLEKVVDDSALQRSLSKGALVTVTNNSSIERKANNFLLNFGLDMERTE